jgi:transcription elongation factor Elf1
MTQTAEWICTRCGSTNRKLVDDQVTSATDKCVSCHARHDIEADSRPVRWRAKVTAK